MTIMCLRCMVQMTLPAVGFYAGAYADQNNDLPKLPWPDMLKLRLHDKVDMADDVHRHHRATYDPPPFNNPSSPYAQPHQGYNRPPQHYQHQPPQQKPSKTTTPNDDEWWK